MKNGYCGALKSGKIGSSCKANKCSDAGTGDLGVLPTHEASLWFSFGDAGSSQTKLPHRHTSLVIACKSVLCTAVYVGWESIVPKASGSPLYPPKVPSKFHSHGCEAPVALTHGFVKD